MALFGGLFKSRDSKKITQEETAKEKFLNALNDFGTAYALFANKQTANIDSATQTIILHAVPKHTKDAMIHFFKFHDELYRLNNSFDNMEKYLKRISLGRVTPKSEKLFKQTLADFEGEVQRRENFVKDNFTISDHIRANATDIRDAVNSTGQIKNIYPLLMTYYVVSEAAYKYFFTLKGDMARVVESSR